MSDNNLNQLFNRLYKIADTSNYTRAFNESAKAVEKDAKDVCPVDTGRLRDSIRYDITGTGFKVSANTEYASYVEYGTIKQSPQPYLVPALRNNKDNIINNIKEDMRRIY